MTERIWDRFLTKQDKAVFKAAGYGALAAWGKRPALIVVDVNYAFSGESPMPILESIKKWYNACGEDAWEAIRVLQQLIAATRAKGIPVIYTTGTARPDGWTAGSWTWKNGRNEAPQRTTKGVDGNVIVEEIKPSARDIIVRKEKPSGFYGTPLESYLQLLGCDSIIVAGTTTSGCVRATVVDAFSLNLRSTVVEDACFDRSQASHAISLCDMNAKYANVLPSNDVLAHLADYPAAQFELPSGLGVETSTVWY
jgi:nicotinamidase-related amidase